VNKKLVSIIVRTKNEERWISAALQAVFSQTYPNFEVILVDNLSNDRTLEKAKKFDVRVVSIEDFLPGKAINLGIRQSKGEYVVCLSGHCIPVDDKWLETLVNTLEEDANFAGVYGRQQPLSYSSDLDKRDLIITFGLDRRIQHKDPFFHNANSILRRSIWDQIPFDEAATNIEDRIWASAVLKKGLKIVYDPDASVYHYHGIHHGRDLGRAKKIVKILETLESKTLRKPGKSEVRKVAAVIPVRGSDLEVFAGRPLLEYSIRSSCASKLVDQTVVVSEDAKALELARQLGADICLERPAELSFDYRDITDTLVFADAALAAKGLAPDVVVYLSVNSPFRRKQLIDSMLQKMFENNYDSIHAAFPENRTCWIEQNGELVLVGEEFVPAKYRDPLYISLSGLATCVHSDVLRSGTRLGKNVGLFQVDDSISLMDIKKIPNKEIAGNLMSAWDKEFG